jgi:peptidoglycan L-alanyl-D-glutamate endopeptidase CwlK
MAPTFIRDGDITHLYPPFTQAVRDALMTLSATGFDIFVFEGLRSFDQQALRYAQGRTTPGSIITRARPGYSWHQYGCAVDLVFGGDGKWSWSGNYDGVERIMRVKGFESLSFERPHFQMTFGLDIDEAFTLNASGGLPAVWGRLDQLRRGPKATPLT